MFNPFFLRQLGEARQQQLLEEARIRRLIHECRRKRPKKPHWWQLITWGVGDWMITFGQRLKQKQKPIL
jgi:hypothetical protein